MDKYQKILFGFAMFGVLCFFIGLLVVLYYFLDYFLFKT